MYLVAKRIMDICLAGITLLVLSPLLVPIAIILKLTGEHYVFYEQTRVGIGGKPFGLLKFATMLVDSPSLATGDITVQNDPRVLPYGRILRKTKINELPQIINVLKGDMGLIGPRPVTPTHFSFYSEEAKEIIGKMRPGLSGAGSILFRDEESLMADIDIPHHEFYKRYISPYKGDLEIWYYKNQSLWLDVKLIAFTVLAVLNPSFDVHKYLKGLPERERPEILNKYR